MPKSKTLIRALASSLVALATCIITLPSGAATNLLKNPGFETQVHDHAWMATNWDTSTSGQASVFFGRDTMVAHEGRFSVNVANVSTLIPMAYNWSQSVTVGPEAWGKDAVFTIWTRTNGLEGRAYILLQAYRDTVSKMALTWGLDREEASRKLRISKGDDPLLDLGWKRQQFSEGQTDWVKREVRVFVPPTVNMLYVRGGLLGTGQVIFDDASLTLETALPADPIPLNTNLLADPGFEGDGNAWEYSMPPFEGLQVVRDESVMHSGKASVRLEGVNGLIQARAGACQVLCNRQLAGKRIRISTWIRTDSLRTSAFPMVYFHGLGGPTSVPSGEQYSLNTPWTKVTFEADVPPDTYAVWVWFLYNTPAIGRVFYDDMSLEVIGPATAKSTPGGN